MGEFISGIRSKNGCGSHGLRGGIRGVVTFRRGIRCDCAGFRRIYKVESLNVERSPCGFLERNLGEISDEDDLGQFRDIIGDIILILKRENGPIIRSGVLGHYIFSIGILFREDSVYSYSLPVAAVVVHGVQLRHHVLLVADRNRIVQCKRDAFTITGPDQEVQDEWIVG